MPIRGATAQVYARAGGALAGRNRQNGTVSSPGAPNLILVPTSLERDRLGGIGPGRGLVELCGFGPVAAAARAAALLAHLAPRRVLLVGIAGTLDPARLPVGAASTFDEVRLEGVGAGEGAGLVGPAELGFPQWEDRGGQVTDRLPLVGREGRTLLTVCAASRGADQTGRRAAGGALAEDMEAFGVALACRAAGVPLTVVRGASNLAGDGDTAGWCVDAALAAARVLALETLDS